MQFHESPTWWEAVKEKLPKGSQPLESYLRQIAVFKKQNRDIEVAILSNEARWHANRRPYYKVYPCIVDALCRLKLDCRYMAPEVPEGTLSIRFAEGHEPRTAEGIKIGSMLVSRLKTKSRQTGDLSSAILIETELVDPPEELRNYWFLINPNPLKMESMEEIIEQGDDQRKKEIQALATRIALTVCMLADDPDIITPDVLADQQRRYDGETDEGWKRRAEEKARKRGVFGWSVGKKIEVTPHIRRPHWAVRHTGPKGCIPKVVPVKGCKVKGKFTEVPTGYMLPDGTEVEDGKALAAP
jgi:hypothetical protein